MSKIGRDLEELRALFDIVGTGGGVDELRDTEVLLTYDLGRILGGRYLSLEQQGEAFSCTFALAAGGAGTFNRIQLRNPLDSGNGFALESIYAGTNVTQSLCLELRQSVADLGTAQTERSRRLPAGASVTGIVTSENAATSGLAARIDRYNVIANIPAHIDWWRYEVGPGHAFYIAQETANADLTIVVRWREYSLR